jgi:hypothetical protein
MALMIVRRWYAHGFLRVVVVVCVYDCENKKIFMCRYAYAFYRVCMYECTQVNGYMNVMS